MTLRFLTLAGISFTLPAQILTLEQAVEKALSANLELAAARAVRLAVPFQQQAARALAAPEFRMSFTNLAVDPELVDTRSIGALRWSPPRPREQTFKLQLVETRARQNEAGIRLAEARLTAKVRQTYRRASVMAERTRLAAQSVSLRQQVVEVTGLQVSRGLKEAAEADLAALALADAETSHSAKISQEKLERFRLEQFVDPTGGTRNFMLEPVSAVPPAADAGAFAAKAIQSRQELQQAEAVCDEFRSAFAIASNQRYPWISTVQVTRRFVNAGSDRAPWGVQIGVDLPLFRSQAKADAAIARANSERCALQRESMRRQVGTEAAEAVLRLQLATTELRRLESLTIGPSDRLLDSARKALDAGRADRIDVLLAELRCLAMRDRLLEKRLELTGIEMELDLATGL